MESFFDTIGWSVLLLVFAATGASVFVGNHFGQKEKIRRAKLNEDLRQFEDALKASLEELARQARESQQHREQTKARYRDLGRAQSMQDTDLQELGLTQMPTTEAELRAAHRARIYQVHPDRGGSTDAAARVNAARDRLKMRFA